MIKNTPHKIIKTSLFLLLILTFYLLNANYLQAQSSSGLSAIPPRLELTVQPDGSASQVIKVRNESKETKTITTEIQDFIVQNSQGTPIIIESNQENNRWAASSWIQISPSTVELKPGETKALTLTVLPPANALPGGHYAMILHTPENDLSLSSTGSSVKTQVGTLVYITIPGDIKQSALLQSFTSPKFSEFGPIDFEATIKNLSDIHIKPVGAINVTNFLGRKISSLELNPNNINIFPYTSRDFQTQLQKKWLFGRYKAELKSFYGTNGGLISSATYFWVIPWRLIILLVITITIILVLIKVLKNKPKKGSDLDEVAELEKELSDLKKKYKDQ